MEGFPLNPKTNKVVNTGKSSSGDDGVARTEFENFVHCIPGIELHNQSAKGPFLKSAGVWYRINGSVDSKFWERRLVCCIRPVSSLGFPFCDMNGNQIEYLGQSAGFVSFAPVLRSKADFMGMFLVVPKPDVRYTYKNKPISFLIVGFSLLPFTRFQGNGPFMFDTNPASIVSWIEKSGIMKNALKKGDVGYPAPQLLSLNTPPPPSVKYEDVQLVKAPVKRERMQFIKAPAVVKPQTVQLNKPECLQFEQRENLVTPDNRVYNYCQDYVRTPMCDQNLIDPRRPSNMSDISQSGHLSFDDMDDDDVKNDRMDDDYCDDDLDHLGLCSFDIMSRAEYGYPSPQMQSFPCASSPPTSFDVSGFSREPIESIGSSSLSLSYSDLPPFPDMSSSSPFLPHLPPLFSNYRAKSPMEPRNDLYSGNLPNESACPDNNPFHCSEDGSF